MTHFINCEQFLQYFINKTLTKILTSKLGPVAARGRGPRGTCLGWKGLCRGNVGGNNVGNKHTNINVDK